MTHALGLIFQKKFDHDLTIELDLVCDLLVYDLSPISLFATNGGRLFNSKKMSNELQYAFEVSMSNELQYAFEVST